MSELNYLKWTFADICSSDAEIQSLMLVFWRFPNENRAFILLLEMLWYSMANLFIVFSFIRWNLSHYFQHELWLSHLIEHWGWIKMSMSLCISTFICQQLRNDDLDVFHEHAKEGHVLIISIDIVIILNTILLIWSQRTAIICRIY